MKQTSKYPLARKNIIIELRDREGVLRCPNCHKKMLPSKFVQQTYPEYKNIYYDYRCVNNCTHIGFTHNQIDRFMFFNYFTTLFNKDKNCILISSKENSIFEINIQPQGNIKNIIEQYFKIRKNLDLLG